MPSWAPRAAAVAGAAAAVALALRYLESKRKAARAVGELQAATRGAPGRIAVIGDFFIDVQAKVPTLPQWDHDVETTAVELLAGGSAANTARQLSTLVPAVRFFAACGDDLLGSAALSRMQEQGFDVSNVKRFPLPSSACIVLSGPGDRAFVSCYSTVNCLTAEHIDVAVLAQCHHLHIGGYLGSRGLHTEALTKLVRDCRERGATTSLGTNSAPDGKWLGENDHLRQLLPHLDLVVVNEREAAKITAALGQPLHSLQPRITVVETRGVEGARIHLGSGEVLDVATRPVEDLVDTTGAGDAFAAGFISRWILKDRDDADAARWGNACSACVLKRMGACAEPVPYAEVKRTYEALAGKAGS